MFSSTIGRCRVISEINASTKIRFSIITFFGQTKTIVNSVDWWFQNDISKILHMRSFADHPFGTSDVLKRVRRIRKTEKWTRASRGIVENVNYECDVDQNAVITHNDIRNHVKYKISMRLPEKVSIAFWNVDNYVFVAQRKRSINGVFFVLLKCAYGFEKKNMMIFSRDVEIL